MSGRNEDPARACRPFDADRDGFVMGEGAALLVLEERDHALRRGARPIAEVVGFSQTCDAYRMTAPLPDGVQAARAITLALRDATIPRQAIDYVKAHGSSTPLNDAAETAAIRRALGTHADRILISGTKGLHAHSLGASGAIEAAITAMALREEYLPPTTNLETLDPACDLDFIRDEGRCRPVTYALCDSFGFGGINAALILRAADQ